MTSLPTVKRVLIGIDDTDGSAALLKLGWEMRTRLDAHVQFVHAVPELLDNTISGPNIEVAEVIATLQEHALEGITKRIETSLAGIELPPEMQTDILPGPPAKVLLDCAEQAQADTIVIGPHQKQGLFDFGSTARTVLAKARCNVWVQPQELKPIERILVPIDSSQESLNALRHACNIAKAYDARLTAFHCFAPPEFAYASAASGYPAVAMPTYVVDDAREAARESFVASLESFDWQGVQHTAVFEEGSPIASILAQQDDFDLIVMGSHGRTGLASVVLGNVAHSVLNKATVPVFAIKLPERTWLL
jgi:nucleotide-binding universal stress UspA family protein